MRIVAVVLASVVAAAAQPSHAQGQNAAKADAKSQGAGGGATTGQGDGVVNTNSDESGSGVRTDAQKASDKMAAAFGESKEFEFSQKYFSLMTGAVVLNPFVLEPDAAGDYFLKTGETKTSFVLELGFRRRWAWLDRWEPDTSLRKARLERQIKQLEGKAKLMATDARAEREVRGQIAELDAELAILSQVNRAGVRDEGDPSRFFGPRAMSQAEGGWWLWPDDYTVRLGFAFGSETPSGAASLVGSSDLYADLALGWNLVRFTPSTLIGTEVPIRGALNIEGYGSVNTDKNLADVQGRGLFGSSLVFGIPYSLKSPAEGGKTQVVELVVRIGAVIVEVPEFENRSTLQVKTKNGLPDFRTKWGGGADIEFNVPIPNDLGYLSTRGTFNMGLDPNPWSLMFGYSIPFGSVWGAVASN